MLNEIVQADVVFRPDGVALTLRVMMGGSLTGPLSLSMGTPIATLLVRDLAQALALPELARSLAAEPQPVPELKYSEAEGVGVGLHDHLENLGLCIVDLKKGQVLDPEAILQRGDLAWADMVQRMLVLAGEKEAERGQ